MIKYNEYDTEKMKLIEDILTYLNCSLITDDKVWEIAREYKHIPSFENILMKESCNEIKMNLPFEYREHFTFYINCIDTHLYLFGNEIYSIEDYYAIEKEYSDAD